MCDYCSSTLPVLESRVQYAARRDGRVVEGNSLENCQGRKLLVSSNLTLSARELFQYYLSFLKVQL